MVSRRSTLALLGSGLTGILGGCFDGADPGTRTGAIDSPSSTPTLATAGSPNTPTYESPDRNTPPADWPPQEWVPEWTHTVPVSHIVGLDVVDEGLVITATDHSGPMVIQYYDPDARNVDWDRELDGSAIENSMLDRGTIQRTWGVTDTGDALLSVAGNKNERWTEVHALDRESGESLWSIQRERMLAVRGTVDGTIYVLATEFEEKTTDEHWGTDTPTPEPLDARLLAIDESDGTVNWTRAFTGVGAVAATTAGVFVALMNRLHKFDHAGNRQWQVAGESRGKAIYPTAEEIFYISKPEWDRMVVRGVSPDGKFRWRHRFDADEAVTRDNRLYVAGDELARIRPDGTVEWRIEQYAGRLTFPPTRNTVYIRTGRQADAVSAVSLRDGAVQWTFDPPLNNAWPESATDETVVAGGIGQTANGVGQPLYRVDASDGQPTARYLDRDPLTTQPLGEHVFVGTGDYEEGGRLLALPL